MPLRQIHPLTRLSKGATFLGSFFSLQKKNMRFVHWMYFSVVGKIKIEKLNLKKG